MAAPGPRRQDRPTPKARAARRGMLLVVVLAIIAVLSLLGASFTFQMNADLAGVKALADMQQARFACDSGIDRVVLLLRESRTDMDQWYNNYEMFRRQLVWSKEVKGGSTSLADQEKIAGRSGWRYSIVAYEPGKDQEKAKMRYGITDESSKINLNVATRGQLIKLFDQFPRKDVTPVELADALLVWIHQADARDKAKISKGVDSNYYLRLNPRYHVKERPLETVEELLMVRGFDGQLVYGEDYNRNGYLDNNENDGPEGAFPPDDGDGILDQGLLPYVTVYSWDLNSANDNKPRVNINKTKFADVDQLPEVLAEELRPEVIEFIAEAQKRGYVFKTVGELYGLEVWEDGTSNYTKVWSDYMRQLKEAQMLGTVDEGKDEEAAGEGEGGAGKDDKKDADSKGKGDVDTDGDSGRSSEDKNTDSRGGGKKKLGDRLKKSLDGEDPEPTSSSRGRNRPVGRDRGADNRAREGQPPEPLSSGKSKDQPGSEGAGSGGEGEPKKGKGVPAFSPVTADDMKVIMDRLTVSSSPVIRGQININTASAFVLRTIVGLTEEEVAAIVARRKQLSGPEKMTPAWLVTTGTLTPEKFAVLSNYFTARAIQFSIDVVGFADHVGTAKRLQAIVEMKGQLVQLLYCRDVTSLGIGYPVWEDRRSEGFAFSDE